MCRRKMQGATIRAGAYYRCTARTMAPGAAALADHPVTVNLREDVLVRSINGWVGQLFDREHIDETIAALVDSQGAGAGIAARDEAKRQLSDAEARLRRFQDAIGAGVDPSAVVEAMNQAHAERSVAKAMLDNMPARVRLVDAEVHAMIDSLGDIGNVLVNASADRLGELYRQLDLAVRYEPAEQAAYFTASPRVDSECVRGASCAQALH